MTSKTACVVMALFLVLTSSTLFAQIDAAFTYQGRLDSAGAPVNADADFRFRLYDAAEKGAQIGDQVALGAVEVTEGLFAVELDFGPDALRGQRWLEIDVRSPAGAGAFVTLEPRQRVTAAPFSVQTRGVFVNANENVAIGTTVPDPDRTLTIQGRDAGGVAQWLSLKDLNGVTRWHINNFNGGLNFAETEVADARLFLEPGGHIGIGTDDPSASLDVVRNISNGNAALAGRSLALSGGGIGAYGSSTSVGGFGVRGVASGQDSTGVQGTYFPATGAGVGVRAICNSPDGFDFLASGAGTDYGSQSSIRWKTNIRVIDRPLEKLAALRGVYYDWDEAHGGRHDVGMIAEEVGRVLPEIVAYEENGVDAIGLDYAKLTPLLVEAVNAVRAEKDAEIEQLERRISELERMIERVVPSAGPRAK